MKKTILAAIIAGLMSVGLMASEIGTIGEIKITDDGTTRVVVNTTIRELVGTPDAKKAMLALVLTAKTTGATVEAFEGDYNGDMGWRKIILK